MNIKMENLMQIIKKQTKELDNENENAPEGEKEDE